MFCRRALQRVGPLARRAIQPVSRNAPVRHMAFGIPGGSSNMAYVVLCGGGLTAAVVYAYKAVNGDTANVDSTVKESTPDLLTAVKTYAGSPVEIAAASVGETSLVKAVRQMGDDGEGLDLTLEVAEPEVLEAATEAAAKEEAAVVVIEEELKSVEAGADAEDDEEQVKEETSAPGAAEEAAASLSASTEDEVGEAEAEDQVAEPGPVSSSEASPEDAAPAEEGTPAEEATAAPEASSLVENMTQLAAASFGSDLDVLSVAELDSASEAPVHEVEHCHSCHSSALEVAPSAALGGQLACEGVLDITHEVKETLTLVEGQTTETMVVVTTQS